MGRTLGAILIAGGVIVGAIVIWLMNAMQSDGGLTSAGAALGIVLGLLVLVLPQLGFGIFLLWKGGQEAKTAVSAKKQRQILDIVKSRGQIPISDLVIEMQSNRDDVQQLLHQLVGMGLYSGYVNWDEGMLYSQEASELRTLDRCKHCDGELSLAGKGVIRCPYCGTEYFL
ncbi:MAG: hypothetical protein D6835_05510 [Candidatus Thermofonsia bacterium]|nr:MAG: hypothetical protein D6835_05510 [Candidatus Thermofonsia bacterium]